MHLLFKLGNNFLSWWRPISCFLHDTVEPHWLGIWNFSTSTKLSWSLTYQQTIFFHKRLYPFNVKKQREVETALIVFMISGILWFGSVTEYNTMLTRLLILLSFCSAPFVTLSSLLIVTPIPAPNVIPSCTTFVVLNVMIIIDLILVTAPNVVQ